MSASETKLAVRYPMQILIVEDNPVNQKVAVGLLDRLGYSVRTANHGLEALELMSRNRFDLVLMDVQMPEMDGLEATRQIRLREQQGSTARCTIVALTTHAMAADQESCFAAGMDDFVAKPVRPDLLRSMLEKWGAKICGKPVPAPVTAKQNPAGGTEAPPVDCSRLDEFSGGDVATAQELVTLYIEQTAEQLTQLEAAVQAGNARETARVAHSAVGASATCGITLIIPTLRELERAGIDNKLAAAPALCARAREEFARIKDYLGIYLRSISGDNP